MWKEKRVQRNSGKKENRKGITSFLKCRKGCGLCLIFDLSCFIDAMTCATVTVTISLLVKFQFKKFKFFTV